MQLLKQVSQIVSLVLPVGVTLTLLAFSTIPAFKPFLDKSSLMCVYIWTLHCLKVFGPITIFSIGLLEDTLKGGLLGTQSLCLLLVHWIVASKQKVLLNNHFILLCIIFTVLAFAYMLLQWALNSLFKAELLNIKNELYQMIKTVIIFPLVYGVLLKVRHVAHTGY